MSRVLEICCASVEDARAAFLGNADRIELCENLEVGGLTPSVELIRSVMSQVQLPVFVLIRVRSGDFVFDSDELQKMVQSIEEAKDLGADGIVCGALTSGGDVNCEATRKMVSAASPLPFTFHRAFDHCVERFNALEDLRNIGVDRVLTSDGQVKASEDPSRILRLAVASGGNPIVMCCGGIRASDISKLAVIEEVMEFHSAASRAGPGVDSREVSAMKQSITSAAR